MTERLSVDATGERFLPSMGLQMSIEHWHRYFLAARFASDADVLDLACGQGYGSNYLAAYAKSVVGVDVDATTIEQAARAYNAPNLRYLQGSVEAIPLPANSVDLVVSFETIEHVSAEQQAAFFAEVRRVLRPAGKLVISTPDKAVYSTARGYSNPYHVREYERAEFVETLRASFAHVRIAGQRAGLFSLVREHLPEATFAISKTEDGAHVPATGELTFEYLIAVCSPAESEANRLPESVVFDEAILTSQHDSVTQALMAASSIAEERAQELTRLYAELQSSTAVTEERAREIEALTSQLIGAQALAEERAERITMLTRQLSEVKALAEQRTEELRIVREAAPVGPDPKLALAGISSMANGAHVARLARSSPPRRVVSASPLVTVAMPSYNHRRFICKAVESVLQQSHENLELIVVDDGSSDESAELLHSRYGADRRVTIVHRPNQGAHHTINEAIARGRGEFVSILNSDDVYEPTRLSTFIRAAHEHGGHPFFGISALRVVDDKGEPSAGSGPLTYYTSLLDKFVGEPDSAAFWLGNLAMTSSNFFFSRDVFDRVGGFSGLRYTHDWDWALRALQHFKVVRLEQVLLHYRVHGANTISEGNLWKHVAENAYVFASAFRRSGLAGMADLAGVRPVDVMRAFLQNESFAAVPTLFLLALGVERDQLAELFASGAFEQLLPQLAGEAPDVLLSTEHLRRKLEDRRAPPRPSLTALALTKTRRVLDGARAQIKKHLVRTPPPT
jgi:SAM-dependent methyltransferase/GT2 family glycosyltransferase